MNWATIKLKDCCFSIADGDHQPPPKATAGIPFVTIANIDSTNQFDFINTMYVPASYYENLDSKRKAQKGDILYSVVGSFGIPVLVKDDFPFVFQRHIAILRPDHKQVDSRFLYYSMLNRDFYAKADSVAIGAAQRTISLGALRNLEIEIPSLKEQRRIADILSAYDDLIENNRKQIKLLEEAAQRLYKEWFIDLHFPGYEHTKIINGIPEGWKKAPLQKFIVYEIGGGWGADLQEDTLVPAYVIRGTDIFSILQGEIKSIPFRFHTKSNYESRALKEGDIVFEVSGGSKNEGVAKSLLISSELLDRWEKPVICASFCKMLRPREEDSVYIYNTLQFLRKTHETEKFEKKSASSIINYRWKDFLANQFVLSPNTSILSLYNQIAYPIYGKICNSSVFIEQARRQRDALLPKLMNGEMEFSV